jgi:hypothetical protein
MLQPRHWSRAGVYSHCAALKRSKLRSGAKRNGAIFSNHYRRPFCAAINRSMKNKLVKTGTKKHGYEKGKTWHLSEKAKPQPCLIFKRHTNSGVNAAHVLPIIQK